MTKKSRVNGSGLELLRDKRLFALAALAVSVCGATAFGATLAITKLSGVSELDFDYWELLPAPVFGFAAAVFMWIQPRRFVLAWTPLAALLAAAAVWQAFNVSIIAVVFFLLLGFVNTGVFYADTFKDLEAQLSDVLKLKHPPSRERAARLILDECRFFLDRVLAVLVAIGLISGTMGSILFTADVLTLDNGQDMGSDERTWLAVGMVLMLAVMATEILAGAIFPLYRLIKQSREIVLGAISRQS